MDYINTFGIYISPAVRAAVGIRKMSVTRNSHQSDLKITRQCDLAAKLLRGEMIIDCCIDFICLWPQPSTMYLPAHMWLKMLGMQYISDLCYTL